MNTKRCGHCKEFKPLDCFGNDKSKKDGKAVTCKACNKEYRDAHREENRSRCTKYRLNNMDRANARNSEWYHANPERAKANRDAWKANNKDKVKKDAKHHHLKKRYNLTFESFEALLLLQNNRCGCCGDEFPDASKIHVDHCHNTNIVRGLLCRRCNVAEGLMETIARCEQLLRYMKKNELFYTNGNAITQL